LPKTASTFRIVKDEPVVLTVRPSNPADRIDTSYGIWLTKGTAPPWW
jgi:hypothetical protein